MTCVCRMTVQGVLQHQQQFQKVTITKHQSVFEPRQMQSFRTNIASAGEGADNGDGEEHPPPLPFKKRHSKFWMKNGCGGFIRRDLRVGR